jgi:hypothetical protein
MAADGSCRGRRDPGSPEQRHDRFGVQARELIAGPCSAIQFVQPRGLQRVQFGLEWGGKGQVGGVEQFGAGRRELDQRRIHAIQAGARHQTDEQVARSHAE